MTFNVGELQATLGIDDSGVDQGISGVLDKLQEFVSKGGAIAAAAGAAIGGGLALAIAAAFETDTITRKLQASLGVTEQEAGRLGKNVGDLFAKNYGDSMDEVADAVISVQRNITQLGDVSDGVLQEITGQVISVAKVFDEDFNAVTRSAGQLMKTGLAKNAQEALDIITKGLQSPVNAADDLLDTFDEYSTVFRSLGLDGKDALGLLSQGLKAGARDADVVADALKEMLLRIQSGDSKQAIQSLGLNFSAALTEISKGGISAKTATDAIIDGLRNIKDPAERAGLAVGIFGTKAEDMQQAINNLDVDQAASQFEAAYGKINGAATDLDATVGGSLQGAFESVWRSMQGFINEAGQSLGPVLKTAAEAFSGLFGILQGVLAWIGDIPAPLWAIGAAVAVWASWQTIAANAVALGLALKGIATAAAGMLVSINPLGLALAAVGVAWAVFSSLGDDAAAAAEEQTKYYESLADSIDQTTGAITAATRATIQQKAEDSGIADALRANGISMELYTNAALGNADAQEQLAGRVKAAKAAVVDSKGAFSGMSDVLKGAAISQEELQNAIQTGDWSGVTAKVQAYTSSLDKQSGSSFVSESITRRWTDAMNSAQGSVAGLDGVIKGAGDASTQLSQAQADVAATTGQVGSSANDAYNKLYSFATISGSSADEIERMGKEAGLTAPEIDSIKAAAVGAEGGASDLAVALADGSSAASEMDAAIQQLQLALDTLAGNTISAEQANRAHNATLRAVAQATRDRAQADQDAADAQTHADEVAAHLGTTLDGQAVSATNAAITQKDVDEATRAAADAAAKATDAADSQQDALDQLADSSQAMTQRAFDGAGGMNNYEAAVQAATAKMVEQRKQFIDSAIAAGVGETAANELADAQGLIPANVRTAYDAIRAEEARRAAEDLGQAVDGVPSSKSVTFSSNANVLISDLSTLEGQIRRIDGSTVTVTRRVVGDQMLVANRGGQIQGLIKALNSSLPGMSGGGQVPGTPPSNPREDNVLASALGLPIMLRSREWVHPEESVDYYGPAFMKAVQNRTFPKPKGYADGGQPGVMTIATPGGGRMALDINLHGGDEIGSIIARTAVVVVDDRMTQAGQLLTRRRSQFQ